MDGSGSQGLRRRAEVASSTDTRLPDFFVIGAQKSGTATLSALLAAHPDVFMSTPREPMFFCRDDTAVHPYHFLETPDLWQSFDWRGDREHLLRDYGRIFRGARPHQLAGEGSCTYLVAREAPARIAGSQPNAKLVVLLRNPIDRAYSAYFHHLKNFRVVHDFEQQLKFEPRDLLETGNYREHVERYLRWFPREQLLIVPFEQFVSDMQGTYDRVSDFLGLERQRMSRPSEKQNEALVPRLLLAQRTINQALRLTQCRLETSTLRSPAHLDRRPALARATEKALHALGKLNRAKRRYPPMSAATRRVLRVYFSRCNIGLSQLAGQDLRRWWPEFDAL